MRKSALILSLALALSVALGGCAALHRVDSDVSTYSQWPAERKPASYAFERLPSQQTRAEHQQTVEDAARAALEAAGFTPAADPASADVSVQLGARIVGVDRILYDDPFWWHGGLYRWRGPYRYSAGFGSSAFGMRWVEPLSYEFEVMLLLRDRQSGQALYEAHASTSSTSPTFGSVMPALFEAALKDFPNGGVNPRRVSVQLGSH